MCIFGAVRVIGTYIAVEAAAAGRSELSPLNEEISAPLDGTCGAARGG